MWRILSAVHFAICQGFRVSHQGDDLQRAVRGPGKEEASSGRVKSPLLHWGGRPDRDLRPKSDVF